MKRVFFVAELGGGFGHVRRLLPLAEAALRAGLRPTFLVTNPAEVAGFLGERFELARAPVVPRQPRPGANSRIARDFADILMRAGFDDANFLASAIGSWRQLIDELRPVAAVCEFSPFLCLATRGGALPVLVTGYGFVLPPPELDHFPALWGGTSGHEIEPRLLEVTNAAARRHQQHPLDSLPAILHGTAHAVTGLRMLDPYARLRAVQAVGPLGLEHAFDEASTQPSDGVFAYLLGDAPDTLTLLRALAASGTKGSAFVRRAKAEHRSAVAGSLMTWLERPAPVASIMRRSRAVAHHASMLLSEEATIAGRPQLLLPSYLEHLLTARALAETGSSVIIRPGTDFDSMVALIRVAGEDTARYAAARRLARAVRAELPEPELAVELLGAVL